MKGRYSLTFFPSSCLIQQYLAECDAEMVVKCINLELCLASKNPVTIIVLLN